MNPDNLSPQGDEPLTAPLGQSSAGMPDLPTTPDVAPVVAPAPTRAGLSTAGVRTLLVGAVAAVVVVALIVAGVAFAKTHATTPSASDILSHAQSASLQDSTYTLTEHLSLNLNSTKSAFPTTFDLTGTGKMTKSPARNDVSIAIPLLGSQNSIEVLTDGSDLYVNLGNLAGLLGSISTITGTPSTPAPTTSGPPWVKIPAGKPIPSTLDYSHLQNVKLIGAEKLNGKDTWHVQGTLDIKGMAAATPNPGIAATETAIATQTGLSVTPVTEDLWFAQDTYFPQKFTVNFSANLGNLASLTGGTASTTTPTPTVPSNSQVTSSATILFTAWNSGATITLPDPSQVGDGSSLFPTPPAKK